MDDKEQRARHALAITVRLVCDSLTDDELATLGLTAAIDGDPTDLEFYDKVRQLFTLDGGTRMHEETRRALEMITLLRLGA